MHDSKRVVSPQKGRHERLEEIVAKHIETRYQKPIQNHNLEAFERFLNELENRRPSTIILDSCCGTGLSTRKIAHANTDALIIGIDQSAARLAKQCQFFDRDPENLLFLQTNCEDFWRLCAQESVKFAKHFILYPNPYPKSEHLKRRWHGHPVFPYLPKLSTRLELRSNWYTYLDEFRISWHQLTGFHAEVDELEADDPLTLFERKYSISGQALYKLEIASNNSHAL